MGALDAMTNWAKVLVEETQAQVLGRLAYLRDLKSTLHISGSRLLRLLSLSAPLGLCLPKVQSSALGL